MTGVHRCLLRLDLLPLALATRRSSDSNLFIRRHMHLDLLRRVPRLRRIPHLGVLRRLRRYCTARYCRRYRYCSHPHRLPLLNVDYLSRIFPLGRDYTQFTLAIIHIWTNIDTKYR